MEKYKNCMILRLLGDKKANKTDNTAEIVFLRGGVITPISIFTQVNIRNPTL